MAMQDARMAELPTVDPQAVDVKLPSKVSRLFYWKAGFAVSAAVATSLAVLLAVGQFHHPESVALPVQAEAPPAVGSWWLYRAHGDRFQGERLIRLVLAEVTEENYILGVTSEEEAMLHGVLGHLPWLGRVSRSDASAYENGELQRVSPLGLELGAPLSFSLFSLQWHGNVTATTSDSATVSASSSEAGELLQYTYSSASANGILPTKLSLIRSAAAAGRELHLQLVASGRDYSGDAWFARARDLFAKQWTLTNVGGSSLASFEPKEHPAQGAWDMLAVWSSAQLPVVEKNASAYMEVRGSEDPSLVRMQHVWGRGVHSLPSVHVISPPFDATYGIHASHQGDGTTNLEVRVAGIIMKHWTVSPEA